MVVFRASPNHDTSTGRIGNRETGVSASEDVDDSQWNFSETDGLSPSKKK